jgi:hypothetical protein
LARNTHNRSLNKNLVYKYARDITAGKWTLTGEPIKFDTTGALIDGQHRLAAIITANLAITTDVRFGLEPTVIRNIDTQRKRTAADFLAIDGEKDASTLAAGLGNFLNYERGWFASMGHTINTHEEIASALRQHPLMRLSVEKGRATSILLPPGVGAALHYLATQVNVEQADLFWQQLSDGTGLTATSPVYLLRERLLMNRATSHKRGGLRTVEVAALVIKAFTLFSHGRTLKQLKWLSQGKFAEPFPRFEIPV